MLHALANCAIDNSVASHAATDSFESFVLQKFPSIIYAVLQNILCLGHIRSLL